MKRGYRTTILFIISFLAFLVHQYLQKIADVHYPFIDSFLDPLLFLPILLPLIVWERRLIRHVPTYSMPWSHVLGYIILISILCEIVLPIWNKRMTSDIIDVLFYAVGGFVYGILDSLDKRCHQNTPSFKK